MADDTPKTSTVSITNTSGGPKVVNAQPIVTLQDGESADVEITDAELAVAKSTGWFEMSKAGSAKAQDKPDAA